MKRRKINFKFRLHLPKNTILISLCAGFILFLSIGAFSVNFIGTETAQRLHNVLVEPQGNFITSFILSFSGCLFFFLLIFLLGTSAFGTIFIYAVNCYRAFGLGFTLGFLFKFYGSNGFLMGVVGILPYSVFYSTLLLLFSKYSIEYSLKIMYLIKSGKGNFGVKLSSLALQGLILMSFSVFSTLYETVITPLIIKSVL